MTSFDLEKTLNECPIPNMLKNGFMDYINSRNIKINSKKDFDKKLEEYQSIKIGGL